MDMARGMDLLKTKRYPVVTSVYRSREHFERAMLLGGDGETVIPRFPEHKETNSQAFMPTYFPAGQWYLTTPAWLQTSLTLTPMSMGGIEVDPNEAIDIDTPDDWELAETFFNSVTRRVFTTVGIDAEIEFVHSDFVTPPTPSHEKFYHRYEGETTAEVLQYAMEDHVELLLAALDEKIDKQRAWTSNLVLVGDFNLYNGETKDDPTIQLINDAGYKEIDNLIGKDTNASLTEAYDRFFIRGNQ